MHFIKKIENPNCQISLFSWNSKYIVKFEMNQMEQTFKVSEMDVFSIQELEDIIDDNFIEAVLKRFESMANDWYGNF